jgi:NAD-dependent SIR2 family protein deacetylase
VTETKRCPKCGETKPLDAFRRDRSKKQGRFSRCRECERQYERARCPKSTAPHHTYPLLKDRAWVEQQYSREFRSIAEIATMVGCSYSTAGRAIERHQIPVIPYGVRRALRARLEAQREGVSA